MGVENGGTTPRGEISAIRSLRTGAIDARAFKVEEEGRGGSVL